MAERQIKKKLNLGSTSFWGYLFGLAGAFFLLALGCILVWPLWYLALEHTKLYTWLFLVFLLAAAVQAPLVRMFRRKRRERIHAGSVPEQS